jgi:diguanylate cyclase (GGDEF)-like protein
MYKGKDPTMKMVIDVVHLSDFIINILYSPHPEIFHKAFREKCRSLVGLEAQAIERILKTVHTEIGRIANEFGIKIDNPKSVEEILQEANIALSLMNLNYEQMNKALVATKLELQKLTRELAEKNRRLEKLAHIDGLTEVYNHRYFQNYLEKEVSRADRNEKSISLVMIDVDHFKAFNDVHGHLAGDFILKELCRLIQGKLREYDLLSRYGGEEFAVVLPETEKADAETVAEKLRQSIEDHLFAGPEGEYQITVSMGVASIQPVKDTFKRNDLIDFADRAMYESKRKGRNRVTVYASGKKWFGKG